MFSSFAISMDLCSAYKHRSSQRKLMKHTTYLRVVYMRKLNNFNLFDKKATKTRLVKPEKSSLTYVSEYFSGKRNAVFGIFLQKLYSIFS